MRKLTILLLLSILLLTSNGKPFKKAMNLLRKLGDQTLKFIKAYDLELIKETSSIFYYSFKVEIGQKLSEGDSVDLDVFYNNKKNIATCTHSNSILNCKIDVATSTSYLIEISPKKDSGKVVWENVNENKNISIILKVNVTTYSSVTYLDYVDGKWNFGLKFTPEKSLPKNSLFTLNVVTQEKTKKYIAFCTYDGTLNNCEVESSVKQNDLVYLTNSQEGTSLNWKTALKEDIQIPRLANLNYVKAYELIYASNKWSFKIQTEGGLPENSMVTVDLIKNTSATSSSGMTTNCIYAEKILSCTASDTSTNLIMLKAKKDKGTVTWNNLKISEIKIPLNTTMKFTKSYGLLFAGKWHFMIDATSSISLPYYPITHIDIIHNSVETTASCEILGGSNKATNIFCVSDYEIQTENDIITINPEKKYGSIEWSPKIEPSEISKAESQTAQITFTDAYDLNYLNNKWIFTIRAKAKTMMSPGGKYIVDIIYKSQSKVEDSTATCLLREGKREAASTMFICVADNSNQNEEDLVAIKYVKSDLSTITWTAGITDDYKITLKTELTLVKAYDLIFDKTWSFSINVKDGILPPDSKVIIDIYKNTYAQTLICTSKNKNCIFCQTSITSSSDLISLSNFKSLASSITWKENLQNDYRIFLVKEMNYVNATNLTFDETDNKWHFDVFTRETRIDSKIIIDIFYGNKPSTATCISYKTSIYSCIVDEKNQNKLTLIKISSDKSVLSTITWKNLYDADYIILSTELTLDQTGYLRTSPDDGETWVFEILVEDENIPEDSKIIIDIYSEEFKTVMYSINYGKVATSTAICFYHNKRLDCTADSSVKGNKYCISLKTEKTLGTASSIKKWNKVDKQSYPILLVTSLNYHFCTHIELIEDKYIFYCQVHQSTVVPKGSEMTVDILIGTTPSISRCKADNSTYLKCEVSLSNAEYAANAQNIYLSSKKTDKSTVTFSIYENQYLFPIELEFIHAYDGENVDAYRADYPFRMLAKGDKLKDGLRMRIKVRHIMDGKIGTPGAHNTEDDVPCEIYGGIFFCHWYCLATKIQSVYDLYYLVFRSEGDDIKWKNPGNVNINEGSHHLFKFEKLNYIKYKENSYEFSLNIKYNGGESYYNIPIIIDIYINKKNTYAYCVPNEGNMNNIICTTSEIEYKKSNVIALKYPNYLGNSDISGISDNYALIGNEYYFIKIVYIYGLNYNSNKWSFKIETKDSITNDFGDSKTLDIFINGNPSLATCTKGSTKLINCEVNNQKETDLIKLYIDNMDSEATLQLLSEKNDGIPFDIGLELIKAYDLEFDNLNEELSFKIQAKVVGDIPIPTGSTFSTMVTGNELVFCSQNGNIENNLIIMICKPKNKISKNTLISLITSKAYYTSITWKKSGRYDILYATELDVYKVDDLQYDSLDNIWSFNMYLSDTDLPINSKVEIDLVYNNKDVTGTCELIEKNKLSCSPNVETQSNNDIFTISPTKKNGGVTYKNDLSKLKFTVLTLEYERYSDLKYNDNFKWEFKIILAQTNVEEGTSVSVDILLDGSKGFANCILKSKNLECEINKNGQTIQNEIKLVKNKQNTDLFWINLPDVVDMYMNYKIRYINSYGGFHDNIWKFNIYHEAIDKTRKLYDINVLLDILVDNVESTALCEISFASFLKCVSQHKNQNKNNIIKIPGNSSPIKGTVFFEPKLDGAKQINPISLSINYESIDSFVKNNIYQFTIKGTSADNIEYEIEDDTVTGVEILEDGNQKEVACLTNDIGKDKGSKVEITCLIQENISTNKDVVVSIDDNGLSKYVKFNNPPEQMVIKSDSIIPKVIVDTSAKEDNDNRNENSRQNIGKCLCVNYIELLFLLLIF